MEKTIKQEVLNNRMFEKKTKINKTDKNEKPKVYTIFDQREVIPCASGQKIYEWCYLADNGEIKKDKRNIFEEVQSYKDQVNYKKRIEQEGEGAYINENNDNGMYLDTTKFGDDYNSVKQYLDYLMADAEKILSATNITRENQQDIKQTFETPKEVGENQEQNKGEINNG